MAIIFMRLSRTIPLYITTFEQTFWIADTLRDCRKSPKRAILAILHVMKSNSYEHQKLKFMVFRQSLQISQIRAKLEIVQV